MSAAAANRVFVSLGSNVGDRAATLMAAREALAALPGTRIVAQSRVYETAARELEDQPDFLNQVVCLDTALSPHDLLGQGQRIEREHGRVRGLRFGPRTLDVDILLFQDFESDEPVLTLPHPRMVSRAFVLVPLADIWGFARGMPGLDVAGLAAAAARDQVVRPYVRPGGTSDEQA